MARTDSETVRVDGVVAGEREERPAGLLRFHPLGASPRMAYVPLQRVMTIGRAEGCDICVDDEQVSRQHARLEPAGESWRVLDAGSANGVFVNGARVESRLLVGGEVIRVGATFFRFFAQGLAGDAGERDVHTEGLVSGPALDEVRAILDRAATSDITVLVTGETGTGKEVAASQLHQAGPRRQRPFVGINCSAIPQEILESELFGHVKGAFTGAMADKPGLIRQAEGGTLFLDEIGELPLASQAKLLRVLQERRVRPVGGSQALPVDVRVVCATNRDLPAQVREGRFRPDLYARIAELTVRLPPLRERLEEVPLLVEHFLAKHGHGGRAVSTLALEHLACRAWPFNVRELESAVRRALLLAGTARELEPSHFAEPEAKPAAPPAEGAVTDGKPASAPAGAGPRADDPRAAQLEEALRRHRGDVDAAAAELGMSRSQLYRRAKKYGITVGHFRV